MNMSLKLSQKLKRTKLTIYRLKHDNKMNKRMTETVKIMKFEFHHSIFNKHIG